MPKFINAREAVDWIPAGANVASVGFTMIGVAEEVLRTLEEVYRETGHPRDLTLIHSAGQSDREHGIAHLAHEGLLRRVIGSHWGLCPPLFTLIDNNGVEGFCMPQGQMANLYKAIAAGRPGLLSKVGLHTFVDPRLDGGRINDRAPQDVSFVDLIDIDGEEYLLYKALSIDVILLRGTTCDEAGNVTMEEEALKLEALSAAQAAKRSGGKVIVQVKNVAAKGSLHPKEIVIPGILVDGIVVAEDPVANHRQSAGWFFDPSYSGDVKTPASGLGTLEPSVRKVIGQRSAVEIADGDVINLGTGIPGDTIGPVVAENGRLDKVRMTVESGVIGGVPSGGTDFGVAQNPEVLIQHDAQFDYYNGVGVDVTFMGAAQVDQAGNVNVSRFGGRTVGCGGFIDITQSARKIVFCFTFTAGGFRADVGGGLLSIHEEGRFHKFINRVDHITFSGPYAVQKGQTVLYVTERAVFRLTEDGLALEEIAPGVNLQRDVLDLMDFEPVVSKNLRQMDSAFFGADTSAEPKLA